MSVIALGLMSKDWLPLNCERVQVALEENRQNLFGAGEQPGAVDALVKCSCSTQPLSHLTQLQLLPDFGRLQAESPEEGTRYLPSLPIFHHSRD